MIKYFIWKKYGVYGCSFDFGELSFRGKEKPGSLAEEQLKESKAKILLSGSLGSIDNTYFAEKIQLIQDEVQAANNSKKFKAKSLERKLNDIKQ